MRKRILSLVLVLSLLFAFGIQASAEVRIKILYGKDELVCDVAPMLVNDRTMVPLRAIFEAIGATVDYEEDTQRITAIKGDTTVILRVGDNVMYVDGKEVQLDSPAFVVNGRTLVPLRACAESFGLEVEWWEDARIVKIKKGAWLLTEKHENGELIENNIYDARGNLLEHTLVKNKIATSESYTYDAYENVLTYRDDETFRTYTYDAQYRLEKLVERNHYGDSYIYTYNTDGTVSRKETMGRGIWESYTYDADGKLRSVEDSTGYVKTYTYDANGYLLTDYATSESKRIYDAQGRLIREETPYGMWTNYTYDEAGNLLVYEIPNEKEVYTYDEKGNVLTYEFTFYEQLGCIEKSDLFVQYTYDAQNRVIREERNSDYYTRTTEYVYDAYGRLVRETVKRTDALDEPQKYFEKITEYIYDAHGNLIETVHADGTKTTCKYAYYVL